MTPEAIRRVQASYDAFGKRGDVLASEFYRELFGRAPNLRHLFPDDLTSLKGHFDAALALIVRNLGSIDVIESALSDLGAQHVHWGARPEDYLVTRQALVAALKSLSGARWSTELEQDWHAAITEVSVAMVKGAAVETAAWAERLIEDRV